MGWGRYCYIGVGVDIKIWGGGGSPGGRPVLRPPLPRMISRHTPPPQDGPGERVQDSVG